MVSYLGFTSIIMKVLSVICLLIALIVSVNAAGPHQARAARHAKLTRLSQQGHHSHDDMSSKLSSNWAKMMELNDVEINDEAPVVDPLYVWPLPASYSRGNITREFSAQFRMTSQPMFDDIIQAIARYTNMIFNHRVVGEPSADAITELNIVIANQNVPLQLDTDGQLSQSILHLVA